MKLKMLHNLPAIVILSIFLILAITLIPDSWARIVLGLPFLLFFPGYVLVAALFVKPSAKNQAAGGQPTLGEEAVTPAKGGVDGIERVALSFGMSIAVTALIGLGLNYTPWGIRLLPVLFSIFAFILILSGIAAFRQYRLDGYWHWLCEYNLKLPGWEGSRLNKALTVILVVAILGSIGTLIYTVAFPKVGERFSEFYILGLNGKAEQYPSNFLVARDNFSVISTRYGDAVAPIKENYGRVILGIVNQEQQPTVYAVEINRLSIFTSRVKCSAALREYNLSKGPSGNKKSALRRCTRARIKKWSFYFLRMGELRYITAFIYGST
jgi:uncharacterized membrane protein